MAKGLKIGLVILLIALVGAGLYFYLNPKKALNIIIPEISDIENIHVKFKGDTALINLTLDVENKSLFKLNIDTLSYHIQLDTSTLLSKSQPLNLQLLKRQKDSINVPLALPFKRLMKKIRSLQGEDSVNIPIEVRIVYSTVFGKAVLPYSKTVRIEVPHPPKFEVEKIEYVKREKKTVFLNAHIKMINYGKINLDVSGLSYTLTTKKKLFTAKGSYPDEIHVRPKSVIAKTLPIKIEINKLFKTLGLIITNKDKVKYHLIVKGFIKNNKLGDEKTPIEIEKDGTLEIKK